MKDLFTPFKVLSPGVMKTMIAAQVVVFMVLWMMAPMSIVPNPKEVVVALLHLNEYGFVHHLIVSFVTNCEAIVLTTIIGLGISYLAVMPAARPLVALVSKFRFNSLVGLSIFFMAMTSDGHMLKLSLLVFGMTVWFVTSMSATITATTDDELNHAYSLGMSRWEAFWEVIVLGKADQALEALRQNAAIGWVMLTLVEGIVRSEGGIGAVLADQTKHHHLDKVFAVQITVLVMGILIDYGLGGLRRFFCPYAYIGKERS